MDLVNFLNIMIEGMLVEIMLNGRIQSVVVGSSLLSLMQGLNITSKAMAIAVNMQVIKKEQWGDYQLKEGDEVEILDFVGGG